MRGTLFYKMTGSGNDFVMLDGRVTKPGQLSPAQVQAMCDRRQGIGADGLVLLAPEGPGAVRMTYWNSDGSRVAMCGNAALCAGRLAVALELTPSGEFCLVTDAGPIRVRVEGKDDRSEINLPEFDLPEEFSGAGFSDGERWMARATVGVPHLVVRVEDTERVDLEGRGKSLRFNRGLGKDGANVNFVAPAKERGSPWLIRTYERGVEGETLACGTGTVAAALSLVLAVTALISWLRGIKVIFLPGLHLVVATSVIALLFLTIACVLYFMR